MFEGKEVSDALNLLPSWIAYQGVCVEKFRYTLEVTKLNQKKVWNIAFVSWEQYFPGYEKKPTDKEREVNADIVAFDEDMKAEAAKLDLKLAEVALGYLQDKFLALRKIYEDDRPPLIR